MNKEWFEKQFEVLNEIRKALNRIDKKLLELLKLAEAEG